MLIGFRKESTGGELRAEGIGHRRVGKVPTDDIPVALATTAALLRPDAAVGMEGHHGVDLLAEAAQGHGDLDDREESRVRGF